MHQYVKTGRVVAVATLFLSATDLLAFGGARMSDTVPVTGYYRQNGEELSRRSMRKTMREMDSCAADVRRGTGLRATGTLVGLANDGVSVGLTIAYVAHLIRGARESADSPTHIATGPSVPHALTVAMDIHSIVGGVVSLGASALQTRGDYLFRRATDEFNENLCFTRADGRLRDRRIFKVGRGVYEQDGLAMPEGVLYHVLREEDASRAPAIVSGIADKFSGTGYQLAVWFVSLALADLVIQGGFDETSRRHLWTGIGIGGGAALFQITGVIGLHVGIKKYNKAMPEPQPCGGAAR